MREIRVDLCPCLPRHGRRGFLNFSQEIIRQDYETETNVQKPRRQFAKSRYRIPKLTEGQWRFLAATLSTIAAGIQFLATHWR